jgi:hypothetical protein
MPLIVGEVFVAIVHPVTPGSTTAYVIPVFPLDVAAVKVFEEGNVRIFVVGVHVIVWVAAETLNTKFELSAP